MKIETQDGGQMNPGNVPGFSRHPRFDASTGSGGLAQNKRIGDDPASQAVAAATKEGQVI